MFSASGVRVQYLRVWEKSAHKVRHCMMEVWLQRSFWIHSCLPVLTYNCAGDRQTSLAHCMWRESWQCVHGEISVSHLL